MHITIQYVVVMVLERYLASKNTIDNLNLDLENALAGKCRHTQAITALCGITDFD